MDVLDEAAMRDLIGALIRDETLIDVGPDANFFEAGLTSALLLRVHARLLAAVDADLPVWLLFKHPTRRSLARRLVDGAARTDRGPATGTARPPAFGTVPGGSTAEARRALRNRIRGMGR